MPRYLAALVASALFCSLACGPDPRDEWEAVAQELRSSPQTPLAAAARLPAAAVSLSWTDASGRQHCLRNPTIGDLQSIPPDAASTPFLPDCYKSDLACVINLTANCPFEQGVSCSFDTCGCGDGRPTC